MKNLTAKIKIDENKVTNLVITKTFEKTCAGWGYITYGIVTFKIKDKISFSNYEKENNVFIPLFHKGYDSFKKDAELFKIENDLYAVFTYRKEKRAVKLQTSKYHDQLYFYNSQL
jgi:predicted HTH domain antitoxin